MEEKFEKRNKYSVQIYSYKRSESQINTDTDETYNYEVKFLRSLLVIFLPKNNVFNNISVSLFRI